MTVHISPERALPSQEAVDLVVALQRCLTSFHALQEEPPVLEGQDGDGLAMLGRYVEARRARSMIFGHNLFADPAWDMLLLLFQAELEERIVTLEQLSETSRLSMNLVLGQVGVMERRGLLVEHQLSHNSRRRRVMRLTPLAMDAMVSWLSLAFGPEDGNGGC
jgi:hypothetical protein